MAALTRLSYAPGLAARLVAFVGLVALLDGLAISLTRRADGVALIWLSSAVLIVLLLRSSLARWPGLLAAAGTGDLLAYLLAGDASGIATALTLCHLVHALVIAGAIRAVAGPTADLAQQRVLGAFAAVSALAPALTGLLAGMVLMPDQGGDFVAIWRQWYLGNLFGVLIIAPALMLLTTVMAERRLLDQRLATTERQVVAMASHIPGLLFRRTVATDGRVAVRLIGSDLPRLLDIGGDDVVIDAEQQFAPVHPDDRAMLAQAWEAADRSQATLTTDVRVIGGDGRTRWMHVSASRQTDAEGALIWDGISVDVTDRREAEEQLRVAKNMAEAANSAKSDFLATMSHEIRTPMTGVLGMIDLLQDAQSEAERTRYFAAMRESATNLLAVLNDILDFSKIEAGKLELNNVDFSIEELTRSVGDLFSSSASAKGLTLCIDIDVGDATTWVRGDAPRIRQVICNLVSNAIKFTEDGGVYVTLRRIRGDNEHWRLEVRDTGVGIAPEAGARLFSAFVQADGTATRRFGGTGLGLAICKRLVEAMSGEIGFDSTPEQGSTFWVKLQLASAMRPPQSEGYGSDLTTLRARRGLSILLAEDNGINQLLISAMMRRLGHNVRCVGNGRLAVEAVASERYDAVLMDMQMPIMDGREATLAIRAAGSGQARVPIIALTADAAAGNRPRYEGIGLDAFLTKPVDIRELAEVLAHITSPGYRPARPCSLVPAADAPPTAQDAFDQQRLRELEDVVGGASLDDLLLMLARDIPVQMAALREAAEIGDTEAMRRLAHTLKGAAGNIAAERLSRAARSMEQGSNPGSDPDAIGALLDDLQDAAQATLCAIADITGDSSVLLIPNAAPPPVQRDRLQQASAQRSFR